MGVWMSVCGCDLCVCVLHVFINKRVCVCKPHHLVVPLSHMAAMCCFVGLLDFLHLFADKKQAELTIILGACEDQVLLPRHGTSQFQH